MPIRSPPRSRRSELPGAATISPARHEVLPSTAATSPSRSSGPGPPDGSHEYVERQQRAHENVRHVDRLANSQVDRHAAQRVRLTSIIATLLQVPDHIEQSVARSDRRVLTFVLPVLAHADTRGGKESLRSRQLR